MTELLIFVAWFTAKMQSTYKHKHTHVILTAIST